MLRKLLLHAKLFSSVFIVNAQNLTNLVFETEIQPSAITVDITFDYIGITVVDVFKWQLFLARLNKIPDWRSGRNIAYKVNVVTVIIGSGTQAVTPDVFNNSNLCL